MIQITKHKWMLNALKQIDIIGDGYQTTTRIIILNDDLDYLPENYIQDFDGVTEQVTILNLGNIDMVTFLELQLHLMQSYNSKIEFYRIK